MEPKPYRRRVLVGARLDYPELATLDVMAKGRELNRSTMLRYMLAYAIRHMPQGWKP